MKIDLDYSHQAAHLGSVNYLGSVRYKGVNFKKVQRLGRGAFGDAFLIESPCKTERLVCKEIFYGGSCRGHDRRLKSFEQELKLLRISAHPNVIQLYHFERDKSKETAYLFMEYCEEGDLSKFIQKFYRGERQLTEQTAWEIIFQLSAAISYCHHGLTISGNRFRVKTDGWKAILHRDIKPANVLLATNSEGEICVKLCDFGIGKVHESMMSGTYVGTSDYKAPEITRESSIWTMKADIYSFGRTIQKLTKHRKFHKIDSLVNKCLSVTPKDRPSSLTLLEIAAFNVNRVRNFQNTRHVSFGEPNYLPKSLFNIHGWQDCMFSTIVKIGSLHEPRERNPKGPFRQLRLLMEDGGDAIKKEPTGNTPLHEAVETGNYVLARNLLELKAKPDAVNNNDRTALFLAAERGDERLLMLLLHYHGETVNAMHDLAVKFWEQGQLQQAENEFMPVWKARSRTLGPEHEDTLTTMNYLAQVYGDQKRLKEAEDMSFAVLEARSRVLGPQHPETLTTMHYLARVYGDRGRLKESEHMLSSVLKKRSELLGPQHPDTLRTKHGLAVTFLMEGRLHEAEDIGTLVLEERSRVLGPGHPDTLRTMERLAFIFEKQGRRKEMEELRRKLRYNVKKAREGGIN